MEAALTPSAGRRGALVFVGFMGAGKTTAARDAAIRFGMQLIDSDAVLERRLGHSIAEEFELRGEASFRAHEERLVCELLERADRSTAIALGGGSVLSKRVRAALARHTVVLLDVDPDTAWRRAAGRNRPLARDRTMFGALYAQRAPLYEQLADVIVPAALRGTVMRMLKTLELLEQTPAGTRMLWATTSGGDYPVLIGAGLLGAGVWPIPRPPSRRFCVADENVARLYLERLGEVDGSVVFPAGETSKTPATAELVWRALAAGGMSRDDHIVALGGGVVGDVAGFCAAGYQRGVPIVHVPTTLVAQVDSAYGGKTGVDLPEAKNYVGAYHQPVGVLVDPETLATLPAAEYASGYAEVLKTALLAGGELWRSVAAGEPIDPRTIFACARVKLSVVARDERDAGPRQMLNLGHTVGHAIETATGYARYRHGEAVGLGLLAALRLSDADALRREVVGLLQAHGLPTQLDGADVETVLAAVARDKKRRDGAVRFVLLERPGAPRVGVRVSDADLDAAVRELM
jgi:shikimate kinase/3-dehydroquinate synthase